MSSMTPPAALAAVPPFSSCITACEACLVACRACPDPLRASSAGKSMPELLQCMQLCEMALHALWTQARMAPAACEVFARSCEKVAAVFMLLPATEPRRCARACYRAAQECRKVAALGLHETDTCRHRQQRHGYGSTGKERAQVRRAA